MWLLLSMVVAKVFSTSLHKQTPDKFTSLRDGRGNMKFPTKPMSSPSRTDKFPPPLLMRFLRTNPGSRSKGRSRSSPMFVRKKNAVNETQEPSSPKVTCIGQVRVRRSSKSSGRAPARVRCSCSWLRKALFRRHFSKRVRHCSFCPSGWPKCGRFFRFGHCRRAQNGKDEDEEEEEEEDEAEAEAKVEPTELPSPSPSSPSSPPPAAASSSPPKNALLLTRCRSAPYRSSSLACRFWGSPLSASGTEEGEIENRAEGEANCRDSATETDMEREREGNSGIRGELEGSEAMGTAQGTQNGVEEPDTAGGGGATRPVILTRCKSEPASTGERLDPAAGLWREKRLGFSNHSSL
ncbi:uncharacterized protein LOC127788898 [Diospyros lotus]|uniref:uncharacterized protein LOC127788898 n=1 Tax=Diospyros lotus TaxID=55363 RepID=UPI00225BF04D|nr:uncharacterized protein LOC127788898 [Diospyros lotus]